MTIKLPQILTRLATLSIFVISIFTTYTVPGVSAVSQNVMIRRVLLSGSGTNTTDQEYVELFNNSDIDVDVTGWCLQYNQANISCIHGTDPQTLMFVKARASILVMNPSFQTLFQTFNGNYRADLVFNAGGNQLAVSGGSLRILSQQGTVADTLGWVNGVAEAGPVTPAVAAGKAMQRRSSSPGFLIDTDNNSIDFDVITEDLSFSRGGLYESVLIVDQCLNSPETIEEIVPENFFRDSDGNCYEDICLNISDLQTTVPNGYQLEAEGCTLAPLLITEILPNITGSDTGKEFVEIHNPGSRVIDLNGYTLQLNPGIKKHIFSTNTVIQPGQYLAFTDTQLGFTLPNTSASISLYSPDQTLLFQTQEYLNPKDDHSWALINNVWQYTQVITPATVNYIPAEITQDDDHHEEEIVSATVINQELVLCGAGKYRNPETNRCKAIESTSTELAPCSIDQERNPETNRCRKITLTSAAQTPCTSDQERNPETNRCRKIGSAEDVLKACTEGQERNPETNRCRKAEIPVSGTVLAATTTESTASDPFRFKTQIIALLITALLGYGLFEYRRDIQNYVEKIRSQTFRGRPKN